MAEYLSPGVYVEEYDHSPRAMEGVGTSTAGFVGMAQKGPSAGAPVYLTSYAEFIRKFGDYLPEYLYGEHRFLASAVEQFFANGGTKCFVSRVTAPGAAAASFETPLFTVSAANEGSWGNRIQLGMNTALRKKMQLQKKIADGVYEAKSVAGFSEGDLVVFEKEYNRIVSIFDTTVTFEVPFQKEPTDGGLVPKKLVFLVESDISVRCNDETENYAGVSFNIKSANYIGKRMEDSALVVLEPKSFAELENPVTAVFGEEQGILTLTDGSDGSIEKITAETYIGSDKGSGKRSGIQSFIENDTVSMLAVPGITIPEVVVSLVAHCENSKNRFAVIDMPKKESDPKKLIEYRELIDSSYAAMYHPWIMNFDRSSQKPDFFPPSGAIMGIYAKTDISRGVHKAPANEAVACTDLNIHFTTGEQDILNPAGINLIRRIPGAGIRVWGARTASSDAAFRYVNVRRLFIFVEESIKNNTNWVVFEPHDSTLWTRVQITISAFLNTLWRSGMLAGDTPEQSYFVEIGPSTMTQDDIANGRLICNIGIAPSKPAEFVIFRVTQFTSEAAGE